MHTQKAYTILVILIIIFKPLVICSILIFRNVMGLKIATFTWGFYFIQFKINK